MQDELMPTFKRLKDKHPSARLVWFQHGKVWNSRLDAQEAMRERGERGREGDARQRGGFRERKGVSTRVEPKSRPKLDWKPRGEQPKLDWKPRDSAAARPAAREEFRRPKAARPGARRDKSWRPGGDHKDPRQKYKDAKKAKWQRFKKNIRSRWEAKQTPGKKRRDEES
jgi:hypothetical protein